MSVRKRGILIVMVMVLIIAFALVMNLIFRAIGIRTDAYQDITDRVTYDIIHTDGTIDYNEPTNRLSLTGGETIIYHVMIPTDPGRDRNYSLAFEEYNSTIDVRFGDELLYTAGHDLEEAGRQIGDVFATVSIPEDAYGREVTVESTQIEKSSSSHYSTFVMAPSAVIILYPIAGNETEFLAFISIFMVSMIALFGLIILSVRNKSANRGIWLCLFFIFISLWYLGYRRMLYPILGNLIFCSMTEYYALFLAPIPLILYIRTGLKPGRTKRFYGILAVIASAYFVACRILSSPAIGIHFSETLGGLHLLLFIQFVLFLLTLIFKRKDFNSEEAPLLLMGITLAMVFCLLEVLRILVSRQNGHSDVLKMDFGAVGVIIFLAAMFVSYAIRFVADYRASLEKEELKRLAYVDMLTGIPNRHFLVSEMEKYAAQGPYTVAFLDADGLKRANDHYGHETGDALINAIAKGMEESSRGLTTLYGRWGGDEFIVFLRSKEDADEFRRRLTAYTAEVNRKQSFPFEFSFSIGFASSDEAAAVSPTDVINRADERMYAAKTAARKSR